MPDVIYYLITAVLSIVLALLIFFMFLRVKKQKSNIKCTIDKTHIEDCILPNNRGKSIDDVVETLKNSNIETEFSLDFYPIL